MVLRHFLRMLAEYMVGTFCEAHTCQKRQRNQMLKRIRKVRHKPACTEPARRSRAGLTSIAHGSQAHRRGNVGYTFLIVVAVILMAAFYIGLWVYYSQHRYDGH